MIRVRLLVGEHYIGQQDIEDDDLTRLAENKSRLHIRLDPLKPHSDAFIAIELTALRPDAA